MSRDMTEVQYRAALARHGFTQRYFMGYVDVGGTDVSTWNLGANATRRQKLAYLIAESKKASARRLHEVAA